MKRFFTCAVVALALQAAVPALAENLNALRIERADGAIEHIRLHSSLVVKYSANTIVLSHPEITVEYPVDDLTTFSFANYSGNKVYDGVQNSIDEIEAPESRLTVTPEAITVSGKDAIVLYDLRGIEKARVKSDGTAATLSTTGIPAGVYILRAGDLTLKISL